jgi:hypothetical protein
VIGQISQITILLLYVGIMGIVLTIVGFLGGSHCGGREHCEKRFCLWGLFQDYGIYVILISIGIIAIGIVRLFMDLFGFFAV